MTEVSLADRATAVSLPDITAAVATDSQITLLYTL